MEFCKRLLRKYLKNALTAAERYNKKNIKQIEDRIFAIDPPVLDAVTTTLKSMNDWAKEHDPLKLPGAEAAQLTGRDPSQIMTASDNANFGLTESATKTLPSGANTHSESNQLAQASSGRFAEQINQNIFIGITAFAFAMKALGLSTDWLKPALGGKTAEVKMDFDSNTLPTNHNPEYDYIAKIEEMAKKAPPLEQAAFIKIAEKAKTGETKDWSQEEWKKFMQNDHQFNAFLDVMELEAKKATAKARPLTQEDIEGNQVQKKPSRKQLSKGARSSK